MKTKAQILKDNGLDIRLTSVDDLRAISFAMDEYAASFRPEVVVPSENEAPKDADFFDVGYEYGYNDCIKVFKRLNPTLTFTELKHEK